MKSKNLLFILLTLWYLIATITCSIEPPVEYGSLTISFTNNVESRSLSIQDIETDISSIIIKGIHEDGSTFEETIDFSTTTTINALLAGSWDFTFESYNESDQLIGRGAGSANILAKDQTTLSVTIHSLVGDGTVEFTTSWPSELVTDPQIEASLTKVGESSSTPLGCSIDDGSASASVEVEAGTYTFSYALYEGDGRTDTDRVFGTAGSLFLVADQSVSVDCPLVQNEMRLSGSLDVTVDIDLRPAYAVTVTPKEQTIFYSKTATVSVTASPPSSTGSYAYRWYLDGALVDGEQETSLKLSDLTLGPHNVVAFVSTGGTDISDSAGIEVILPETHQVTYDGNGNTTGAVPTDSYDYIEGEDIVVQSLGNLGKDGYYFYSWNTKADGSGAHYRTDDTLPMGSSDLTLYAYWKAVGVPQISAKFSQILMLKRDRTLWATGRNYSGELMDGFSDITVTSPKQVMSMYDEFIRVSSGLNYSMTIKSDDTLWAAGENQYGQLGDGTETDRKNPVCIMSGVVDVATGVCHTLALKEDGSVWGWGFNNGRLGLPYVISSAEPLHITDNVQSIFAGDYCSFIIKSDGTLWATGDNFNGSLGTGDTQRKNGFTRVMDDVQMVSSCGGSFFSHTLILRTNGDLYATGDNEYGQLGDGTTTDKSTPTFITGNVAMVSAGETHSMIVKTDGTLWATGQNGECQLGDGSNPSADRTEFFQIDDHVVFVESGAYRSIYMKGDGSVWVTGNYGYAHFGFGNLTDKRSPIKVFEMW